MRRNRESGRRATPRDLRIALRPAWRPPLQSPGRTSNDEPRTTNDLASDIVVIGGGVNGLVTATLLARGGLKVTLLERGERVGGGALLSHSASIDPALIRSLGLEQHGLRIVRPAADVCAPTN